ncbi:MAG: hypothetical protein ACLT98_01115 [Eggerthellaceae bacterium]
MALLRSMPSSMPHPMRMLTILSLSSLFCPFVRGAAALTASCIRAIERPRERNCGTRRMTCVIISVTTGATLPNKAKERSLFMQAE